MKKAYKLFRYINGKLFPLYVDSDTEVIMNTYLYAKELPPTSDGKIRARKLQKLAYRPGWHCCEVPYAGHIGKKQPDGKLYQDINTAWCEVEVEDSIDYTRSLALAYKVARDRCMKTLPVNGFYYFNTSPNAKVQWLITSGIIVRRILTQDEVNALCRAHGIEPQPLVAENYIIDYKCAK